MKYVITYYDENNHLYAEEFYAYNPIDAICQFEQNGLRQDDIVSIVWVR